jgi:hypothetical protein
MRPDSAAICDAFRLPVMYIDFSFMASSSHVDDPAQTWRRFNQREQTLRDQESSKYDSCE